MTFTAIAFTIFFSVQLITPNQSEAGTTCKTDWLGNYVWVQTLLEIVQQLKQTGWEMITQLLVMAIQ